MSLFGEYVVTPKNLKVAEEKLMDSGITEDELIARAAAALKKSAEKSLRGKDDKILFVTGGGNNGCDGLECARLFWEEGFDVSVFPVGVRRNDGNEKRLAALKAAGVPFVNEVSKNVYRTVVDCVFGIGLTRAPEKEYLRAISEINLSRAFVISDIALKYSFSGDIGNKPQPRVRDFRGRAFGTGRRFGKSIRRVRYGKRNGYLYRR